MIHQLGDGGADRALTRLVNASDAARYRHTILTLEPGVGHEPLRRCVKRVQAPAAGRDVTGVLRALAGERFDLIPWMGLARVDPGATIPAALGLPLVLRQPTNMEAERHYEAAQLALDWRELKAASRPEAVIGAVADADRFDAARLRVRAPIAIPTRSTWRRLRGGRDGAMAAASSSQPSDDSSHRRIR